MKLLSAILDTCLLPVAVAKDILCPWPVIIDGSKSQTREQIEKIEDNL